MKRYDGLFILNSVGHEDEVEKMIEGVLESLGEAGGKVEKIERRESQSFARVADKKFKSGFYFSVIFEIATTGLAEFRSALSESPAVFRFIIRLAGNPVPETAIPTAESE